jgi:uncharacterized protein YkwD
MPAGNYRWWVRRWSSSAGYTKWSSPADFTVMAQIPGALSLTAPSGLQNSTTLAYRWQKDSRATWYLLHVGANNARVFQKWYQGAGTGEMSVTLTGHGRGTTYSWYVRGWSPDGYGPWSGPRTFSVDNGAPAKPTTVAPSGTINVVRPVFQWNAAARATWYRLVVQRGATTVTDKWYQSVSATAPVALAAGGHTWWIGAWNAEYGKTVWSDPRAFTVSASAIVAEYEARVHTLVNNYRTANNLAATTYNSNIAAVARQHSQNAANGVISQAQFIQHHGSDSRFTQVRTYISWSSIAENVAYNQGHSDPPWKAVDQWKKSSAHNINMLNANWNRTGVGVAVSANGTWYFTQIFLKTP